MLWFTAQSLFVILLAFLLGVLVGRMWQPQRAGLDVVDSLLGGLEPAVPPDQAPATGPIAIPVTTAEAPDTARMANGWPGAGLAEATPPATADTPASAADADAAQEPLAIPAPTAAPPALPPARPPAVPPAAAATDPEPGVTTRMPAPAGEAAAATPEGVQPAGPATDRLERIEGIGPKIADALRAAGITSFAALAEADEASLREALVAANLRFAPSLPTWPRQARLLVGGNQRLYAGLSGRLTPGRDASEVG